MMKQNCANARKTTNNMTEKAMRSLVARLIAIVTILIDSLKSKYLNSCVTQSC